MHDESFDPNLKENDPCMVFAWDTAVVIRFVARINALIEEGAMMATPSWLHLLDNGRTNPESLQLSVLQELIRGGRGNVKQNDEITTPTLLQFVHVCRRLGQIEIDPFMQQVMKDINPTNDVEKKLATIKLFFKLKNDAQSEPVGPGPVPPRCVQLFR